MQLSSVRAPAAAQRRGGGLGKGFPPGDDERGA
jgi:hypothetical protein